MSTHASPGGSIPEWTQGDYLRKARESADLTVKQLAERAGLSAKTITNYEGDRVQPRRSSLIAWSFATGVDLDWLSMVRARPDRPDGPDELPGLDSNQQPCGSLLALVRPRLHAVAA